LRAAAERVERARRHSGGCATWGFLFRKRQGPRSLGNGKRPFDRGTMPGAFEVPKSETSPKGVLMVRYARDGEIKLP
jgi:hypothetical protein